MILHFIRGSSTCISAIIISGHGLYIIFLYHIHGVYAHHVFFSVSPYYIQGGTPLHYFIWYDRRKEKVDFLVSLLTEGPGGSPPDVNARTDEGNTPLHLAVQVSGFSETPKC